MQQKLSRHEILHYLSIFLKRDYITFGCCVLKKDIFFDLLLSYLLLTRLFILDTEIDTYIINIYVI